jgi:hypothetical protein
MAESEERTRTSSGRCRNGPRAQLPVAVDEMLSRPDAPRRTRPTGSLKRFSRLAVPGICVAGDAHGTRISPRIRRDIGGSELTLSSRGARG